MDLLYLILQICISLVYTACKIVRERSYLWSILTDEVVERVELLLLKQNTGVRFPVGSNKKTVIVGICSFLAGKEMIKG